MRAFILGAGLGTRLRPLTDRLPKPLVPLFHRPLADWALEACHNAGASEFAINTHHLPNAWSSFGTPDPAHHPLWIGANGIPASARLWRGLPVALFHEPVLLDTGGGLKNLGSWLTRNQGPVLVHNGDIFSTLPLNTLVDQHLASGLPATLALRSRDGLRNVAVNPAADRVTDLRGSLGIGPGTHAFTGIYCIQPEFLRHVRENGVVSIIPAFLELAAESQLGAVVLDEGIWLDLGDPASYLTAHRDLDLAAKIHPDATISADATVVNCVIGPGATVAAHASLQDCVVWPGVHVAAHASFQNEILLES